MGEKGKTIQIECHGDLTVRGDAGASVRVSGNNTEDLTVEDDFVEGNGDLTVRVPTGTSLQIKRVDGDVLIRGIGGDITVSGDVAGNFVVKACDGNVHLKTVHGDVALKSVGGKLTVEDRVMGNLALGSSGGAEIARVYGDLAAKHIAGDLVVAEVMGNAAGRHISGDVRLESVKGDVILGHTAGQVTVSAHDDVRVRGPLAVGKHHIKAGSTINLYYPAHEALSIDAQAPEIRNRMTFDQIDEAPGTLRASRGDGGAHLKLEAGEQILLRLGDSPGGDTFFEAEFDFARIGEQISSEINARMNEMQDRFGPEFNVQAEKALRRAQEAIDRAAQKLERNMERVQQRAETQAKRAEAHAKRAEARAQRRYTRAQPRPPQPPKPPRARADNHAEQLKILSMLEEGTITVEEANELLAALD